MECSFAVLLKEALSSVVMPNLEPSPGMVRLPLGNAKIILAPNPGKSSMISTLSSCTEKGLQFSLENVESRVLKAL